MTSSLAILAVPIGTSNADDVLSELSRDGLVQRFVLLDSEGNGTEVFEGNRTEVQLESYLAERRLDTICFVSLTLCMDGEVYRYGDAGPLAQKLRRICGAAGVEFQALSVVVPDAHTKAPRTAFHADWEANLIVAPEDSAGTRGMAAVGLVPEKVPYVAASAALTLGGAWSWQSKPPLADESVNFVQGQKRASVCRLVVRLVDAGDLTSQMVGYALDPRGVWPAPANTSVHGKPTDAIVQLAARVASAPEVGFKFQPLTPEAQAEAKKVPIWEALRLFFSRLGVHLRALPARKWSSMKETFAGLVEDTVQKKTFGADSDIEVSLQSSLSSVLEVVDSNARLRRLADLPDLVVPAPASTPDTWLTVRSVTFGLVDATEFSGSLQGSEPSFAQQRAVLNDHALAVAPLRNATGGFEVASDDSRLLSLFESDDGDSAFAIGSSDVFSARLFNNLLSEAEQQLHAPPEPKSEEDDSSNEPDRDDISEPPEAAISIKQIGELRARFSEWTEERKDTLLWKLGEHLDHSLQKASDSLAASETGLETLPDEMAEYEAQEEKLLRRIRRRTIALTIFFVLALVGVIATFALAAAVTGFIAAGAFVVVLFLLALGYLSLARQEVRLEHKLRDLSNRPLDLVRARQHAANEIVRLTRLNEQLSDWSDIYSLIIHRPWGRIRNIETETGRSTPVEILSLATGIPEVNNNRLSGVVLNLRRQVCRNGWLTQNFLDVARFSRERYGQMDDAAVDRFVGAEADPATSRQPISLIPATGEPLFTPRMQLLNDLTEARFATELRQRQVDDLSDSVAEVDISRLFQKVSCDVPGLDAMPPEDFLGGIVQFSPLPGFESHFRPVLPPVPAHVSRSIFGMSESIPLNVPADQTSRTRVKVNDVAERFVLAAFRLDLSEDRLIDDIVLVDNTGEDPDEGPVTDPGPPDLLL